MSNGNIFEVYFDYVKDTSESPYAYHRWSFLVSVGAMLGRNVSLQLGHETIYPNMYAVLLGPSASRKSAAIKVGRNLLKDMGYDKFASDKSSKEQFLVDLAAGFGSSKLTDQQIEELLSLPIDELPPSEVYISASELEDFMGARDSGLLSLLTNLYDCPSQYINPKRSGKEVNISKPTVSLLGGATPTTFATAFPPEIIGSGFLSRTPLIYASGPRCKLTLPPPPDQEIKDFLVETLQMVNSSVRGVMKFSKEAFKLIDEIYHAPFPIDDARFEAYSGRRHVHLYKVAMICAALDLSMTIHDHHVMLANSILHYTELLMPKALGEFGNSQNSAITHSTLKVIERLGSCVLTDIMAANSQAYRNVAECAEVVKKLLMSKKIQNTGGRISIVRTAKTAKYPHTDFSMLRESKDPSTKL